MRSTTVIKQARGKGRPRKSTATDSGSVVTLPCESNHESTGSDQFAEIRGKLIEMRKALLDAAQKDIRGRIMDGNKFMDISDEADLADVISTDVLRAANTTRQNARLSAIDAALFNIDQGTYGICDECGEVILMKRLLAVPFTQRCTDCQEEHEMGRVSE